MPRIYQKKTTRELKDIKLLKRTLGSIGVIDDNNKDKMKLEMLIIKMIKDLEKKHLK